MVQKVLITVLSLFLSIHGNCQSPEIINIKKIRHDLSLIDCEDVLRQFDFDFFRSIVFKNDSILFYNPQGTLHLYEITLSEKPFPSLSIPFKINLEYQKESPRLVKDGYLKPNCIIK